MNVSYIDDCLIGWLTLECIWAMAKLHLLRERTDRMDLQMEDVCVGFLGIKVKDKSNEGAWLLLKPGWPSAWSRHWGWLAPASKSMDADTLLPYKFQLCKCGWDAIEFGILLMADLPDISNCQCIWYIIC